jgi:hypothetical protein
MSAIVSVAVDVALYASWWVVKKTSYGLYSGICYLIYGKIESKEDKVRRELVEKNDEDRKKLLEEIQMQRKILEELQKHMNNDNNDMEQPPAYSKIDKTKSENNYYIIDNKSNDDKLNDNEFNEFEIIENN